MEHRTKRILHALIGALLFGAAVWVLHHELHKYGLEAMVDSLKALPPRVLGLAFLFTAANYTILTQYDALAFLYIRQHLPYRKIALCSFIGYAFSNNAGFNTVSGSSVRYRFYSAWGVPSQQILKIVIFYSLTFYVGLFTLGGLVFVLEPLDVPGGIKMPFLTLRPLGFLFLAAGVAYLLVSAFLHHPLRLKGYHFAVPSLRIALLQVVVSGLDWMLASAVLYVLLPPGARVPYVPFLGVFMLAQIAGLISQVPAGLGVFETVVVLFLEEAVPAPHVLGALLAYRAIYYVIPLLVALTMLGLHELHEKRRKRAAAKA